MKKIILLITTLTLSKVTAQDTALYKLRLNAPLLDIPQNFANNSYNISMRQAMEISNDLYEFGFYGIDALGNKIFIRKNKSVTKKRKIGNGIFKYGLGIVFSKFGSELPIPLGVWGHEEYHRSILSVNNVSSKNGNWILNRWDGTVYGVEDSTLTTLKSKQNNELLYSYVAGIQYEIALNEKVTLDEFYKNRTLNKNALLLYNAYYVYDYFKFSTSSKSDTVKLVAPKFESKNPGERDFAGADLTAWAYDMFKPAESYNLRDSFPNGSGVNRRIGFSELPAEAQSYLKQQTKLSLLNFVNPGIFFINRMKLSSKFSFNMFMQYSPTHFGNDIAFYLPFKYKRYDVLVNIHRYSNRSTNSYGFGLGLYNFKLNRKLESDLSFNLWQQPESFFQNSYVYGGQLNVSLNYKVSENFHGFISFSGKNKGWSMSNPYIKDNLNAQIGLKYSLKRT